MRKNKAAILFAILAAALYAINVPLSKLFLSEVAPAMMAGFLYLGAGCGMGIVFAAKTILKKHSDSNFLGRKDLPYTIAMVLLDIVAPILFMYGIANTNSANVSLLNNFEIVATSVIALIIFKEKFSGQLWISILLITLSGILLGLEGNSAFIFNKGSLFVIGACICWGMENNCTRRISDKSSEEIVLIKGIFSGLGSIAVALLSRANFPAMPTVCFVLLLGFVAYGLSINFYILAQNTLGAAKTSAFYSIAPFLGVGFSFAILGEKPDIQFYAAFFIMIISTLIMIRETLSESNL